MFVKLQEGSRIYPYKVYMKEDIQMKAWHYMNNPRISSITLVANDGYVFQDVRGFIKGHKDKGYPGCK